MDSFPLMKIRRRFYRVDTVHHGTEVRKCSCSDTQCHTCIYVQSNAHTYCAPCTLCHTHAHMDVDGITVHTHALVTDIQFCSA